MGGLARFKTLCNYYQNDDQFKGQSDLMTFFSGDAFNPSLESSITKGGLGSALNAFSVYYGLTTCR
jgi:5'-nucleotidase